MRRTPLTVYSRIADDMNVMIIRSLTVVILVGNVVLCSPVRGQVVSDSSSHQAAHQATVDSLHQSALVLEKAYRTVLKVASELSDSSPSRRGIKAGGMVLGGVKGVAESRVRIPVPDAQNTMDKAGESHVTLTQKYEDGEPWAAATAVRDWSRYATRLEAIGARLATAAKLAAVPEDVKHKLQESSQAAFDFASTLRRDIELMNKAAAPILPNSLAPIPLWNSIGAQCFWGTPERTIAPGLSLASAGKDDPAVLGVDLYEEYFGALRFSATSALAASDDASDVQANAQRFIQQGGTLAFGLGYPLLNLSNHDISCTGHPIEDTGNSYRLRASLVSRLGMDVPEFGAQTSQFTGNFDLGLDVEGRTLGYLKVVRVFGQVHTAMAYGPRAFNEAIGRVGRSDPFLYGQGTFGVILGDVVQVSIAWPLFGPRSVRDQLKNVFQIGVFQRTGAPR